MEFAFPGDVYGVKPDRDRMPGAAAHSLFLPEKYTEIAPGRPTWPVKANAGIDTPPSRRFAEKHAPAFSNMKPKLLPVFLAFAFAGGMRPAAGAEERVGAIPEDAFQSLLGAIKPQPKESPWREIEWVTNITEARRRAVAEGKPLVIFTAADGSPLGRT
jgi:hypothetical protein